MINTEDEKNLVWEPVQVEHVIQDRWIDLRKVEYRMPDGSTFSPYYNYTRRSYAVIVASDEDGRFLCVRQYRHGIRQVTTEFTAGGIEHPEMDEKLTSAHALATPEEALAAAKRELEEETGYTSGEWHHMITVPSNPTIADNYAFIFRAVNCRRTRDRHTDDTEFLQLERLTPAEVEERIRTGQFQQPIHIMAWLMAVRKEPGLQAAIDG